VIATDKNAKPDRALLTAGNSKLIREVMEGITTYTKEAIIILSTNPLDTITYNAENESGYSSGRLCGTGTMDDSARLRHAVAADYAIHPISVLVYMMGEHGMSAFLVFSRLNVQGFGEKEFDYNFDGKEARDRSEFGQKVV